MANPSHHHHKDDFSTLDSHTHTLSLSLSKPGFLWVLGIFWIFDLGLKKGKKKFLKRMKEKKKEEQDSMWELELEFHVDFSPHQ